MSFSDHKITAFTHKIADLPDQPNLPADELKARFDSSPEELRVAHNAVCDDAQTLSDKVDNIITETFDGVVEKSMLSTELAAELDAKAEAADLMAEATAREDADDALQTAVSQKCEVYVGTYTGDGANTRTIVLGFKPKAVWVVERGFKTMMAQLGYDYVRGGMATEDWSGCGIALVENGFHLQINENYNQTTHINSTCSNNDGTVYTYLAFK